MFSQTAEDDGFKGTSNLDLGNFTSTQTSEDMDGGWAWVVLFAAFFSLSLTGATTFAAGKSCLLYSTSHWRFNRS